MKRRTVLKLAAALPALVPALAGCGAGQQDSLDGFMPDDAQHLTVYTSHPEKIREPFIREFEDRTGIWAEVVYGGTQEMLNRIEEEAANVQGDVMFGGGVESLSGCDAYFEAYQSPELSAITRREFVSSSNRWTGFSALPLVFVYNTKLLTPQTAPTAWVDLAKTAWSGKIAFCSPEVSGSCYTAIATAIQLYGESWLEGFVKNLEGKCAASSSDITVQVAAGGAMVGVAVESTARQAIEDGADMGYLYPSDGTSIVPDGVAILKGAKNIENAKKFVDFVLSREAQTYLMENLGRRTVRNDLPELITPPLAEIPTMDYDVSLATESQTEWFALWKKLFGEDTGAGT